MALAVTVDTRWHCCVTRQKVSRLCALIATQRCVLGYASSASCVPWPLTLAYMCVVFVFVCPVLGTCESAPV